MKFSSYLVVALCFLLVGCNPPKTESAEVHEETSNAGHLTLSKEKQLEMGLKVEQPAFGLFARVIKATARVQASPGSERFVVARINGVVHFTSTELLPGMSVKSGQTLLVVKADGLADNNSQVRYSEAKTNFERARTEYQRSSELAKDRIVSDKELSAARSEFENAKVVFNTLSLNFGSSGQTCVSPMNGFIRDVLVGNGSYVEMGQNVLSITQNKTLLLTADVPQKYAEALRTVRSATIRRLNDPHVYSFKELNGRILTVGQVANSDNLQLPVHIQIDNTANFQSGSFVEVYLKSESGEKQLSIPTSALMEDQGAYFVWIQESAEAFEKRLVTLGGSDGIQTAILKGITVNDKVVTSGVQLLKLTQSTSTLDAHSGHVH